MQNKIAHFSYTLSILLACFCITTPSTSYGQLKYKLFGFEQFSVGPTASTTGLGLSLSSKIKAHENQYFNFDIKTLHDTKEAKVQNPNYTNPRPYIYGKQNSASVVSSSYSFYSLLGQSTASSPSVKLGFSVGPSIAFVRPYYVYVQEYDNSSQTPKLMRQDPENEPLQNNILGYAGWNTGLDEIKQQFGINAEVNLLTEWDQKYRLGRLKAGVRVDYFFTDLNLLYKNKNQLFTSFFATYQIGGITK